MVTIFMDIFGLVTTVGGLLYSVVVGFLIRRTDPEIGDQVIEISLQYFFLYLFQLTLMLLKFLYGLKWLCYGRTRKLYKQYYYASVTLAGSALPMNLIVSTICFSAKNYPQAIA